MKAKQKRSDAQLKAIRRNYAIRANKAKQAKRTNSSNKPKRTTRQDPDKKDKNNCSKEKLNNYTQIASEFEKDSNSEKKLSDFAKKRLKIYDDSVDPKILDNPWNVHYFNNNEHPKAILAANKDKVLTLGITSEPKDSHPKVKLQDDLSIKGKKLSTYMKTTTKVESKNKIQKKVKDANITNRDKVLVYDSIKDKKTNKENYREIKKEPNGS